MHDPDHRVEDIRVWQRDQVVDVVAYRLEGMLPDSLYLEAVDYAINLFEGDQAALFDAQLHCWRTRGLDADDLHARVQAFQRHRDSGNQTSTADRNNHDICFR